MTSPTTAATDSELLCVIAATLHFIDHRCKNLFYALQMQYLLDQVDKYLELAFRILDPGTPGCLQQIRLGLTDVVEEVP